jgi:hypothetical protein
MAYEAGDHLTAVSAMEIGSIGILTEDVVDPSGRHRRRLVSPGQRTTHGLLIEVALDLVAQCDRVIAAKGGLFSEVR